MVKAISLLAILILGLSNLVANFSGRYTGKLEGADVVLDLTQTESKLTGVATISGVKLDLSGTVENNQASGTISFLGEKLHFKATLKESVLEMRIAEEGDNGKPNWTEADTIRFSKEGTTEQKKFSKEPMALLKDGKEYVHASGGKFKYPANWQVKEIEGGLQLLPNDVIDGETIVILVESAEGKTDSADPEVVAFLDQQVQAFAPGLRRTDKIERAPAGNGKGAILTWDGTVEGKEIRLRGYVTIFKNFGIALLIAAPKEQVERRDATLRQIFLSLGWGQGRIASELVGSWKYYGYNNVSHTETSATAILRADGTFSYSSNSETNNSFSGKDGLGNELWTGWASSRNGSGYSGRWIADGRTLILNFEDGSSESFDYELAQQGNLTVLKLHGEQKKAMEWTKQS